VASPTGMRTVGWAESMQEPKLLCIIFNDFIRSSGRVRRYENENCGTWREVLGHGAGEWKKEDGGWRMRVEGWRMGWRLVSLALKPRAKCSNAKTGHCG
jgi:hypothetical protein